MIEQIEEVIEGWWSEVGEGGASTELLGMSSPLLWILCLELTMMIANYVELIETPEEPPEEQEAPPSPLLRRLLR